MGVDFSSPEQGGSPPSKFAAKLHSAWAWSNISHLLSYDHDHVPTDVDGHTFHALIGSEQDSNGFNEHDCKSLIYHISPNSNRRGNLTAAIIACILSVHKDADATNKLMTIFDLADFNGTSSMNYSAAAVLFISLGTALGGVLQVKASYSERVTLGHVDKLFKLQGQRPESKASYEITKSDFVSYVLNLLSEMEENVTLENIFKKHVSDGTYIKDRERPLTPTEAGKKKIGHRLNFAKMKKSADIDIKAALPYVEHRIKLPRSSFEGLMIKNKDFNGGKYGIFVHNDDVQSFNILQDDEIAKVNGMDVAGCPLAEMNFAVRQVEINCTVVIRRYKSSITWDEHGRAHDEDEARLAAERHAQKLELERIERENALEKERMEKLEAERRLKAKKEEEEARLAEEERLRLKEEQKEAVLSMKSTADDDSEVERTLEEERDHTLNNFRELIQELQERQQKVQTYLDEYNDLQVGQGVLYITLLSCTNINHEELNDAGFADPCIYLLSDRDFSMSRKIYDDIEPEFDEVHVLPWKEGQNIEVCIADYHRIDSNGGIRYATVEYELKNLSSGAPAECEAILKSPLSQNTMTVKFKVRYEPMDIVAQQLKVKEGYARINYIVGMAEQKVLKAHRDKSKHAHKSGIIVITVYECKKLINTDTEDGKGGISDPLVQLQIGDSIVRSKRKRNTLDPVYNEEFRLHWDGLCPLKIRVLDYDGPEQFEPMGDLQIELAKADYGKLNEKTIKINDRKLQNVKKGTISLEFKFVESKAKISKKDGLMDARLTVLLINSKKKFAELDKDNSGYIEGKELHELFNWAMESYASDLRSGVKDQYLAEFITKIDTDHDGKINVGEFGTVFQEAAGMIAVLRLSKRADELHDWDMAWVQEQHKHGAMVLAELKRIKESISDLNADAAPFNESYDTISRIQCIRLQTTIRELHKKLKSSDNWDREIKTHRNMMEFQQNHIQVEVANIEAEQRQWKEQLDLEDQMTADSSGVKSRENMLRRSTSSIPSAGAKSSLKLSPGSRSSKLSLSTKGGGH